MGPEQIVLGILEKAGPIVAAIAFFVWRDWKREDRLSSVIETMQQWQRDVLMSQLNESTSVVRANSAALEAFAVAVQTRPCIAELAEPGETLVLRREATG